MVKYEFGKIYKLVSDLTDKIYIGSTSERYLKARLWSHKTVFKGKGTGKYHDKAANELMQYPDVQIVLIEAFPCTSKDELLQRERYWYDQHKEICVNKIRPIVTIEEAKANQREYQIANKETIRKQAAAYRQANLAAVAASNKQWRQSNAESLKEKKREHWQLTKDTVNAKRRQKTHCACGISYNSGHKARHERSKQHLEKTSKLIL